MGLTKVDRWVSGFMFKSYGFSGFEMFGGLQVWPSFCAQVSGVSGISFKILIFLILKSLLMCIAS